MVFIFKYRTLFGLQNSFTCVAVLGFHWWRSFHPAGQIFIKSRHDVTITAILVLSLMIYSCWGKHYNQIWPNQENRKVDRPVQSYSHVQQSLQARTCVMEYCFDGTRPLSSVLLHVFLWKHFVTSSGSWHSTLHWWCRSFEDSQYAQCLLHSQKRGLTLPCRWNNFGWLGKRVEDTIHCMGCRLVSGSKWWKQHSFWVRKHSRKTADFPSMSEFSFDVISLARFWSCVRKHDTHWREFTVLNVYNALAWYTDSTGFFDL